MVRKTYQPPFPDEPGDDVTFIPGTDDKYGMTENGNAYRVNGQDVLEVGQVPLKPEWPAHRREFFRLRIRLNEDPPKPERPSHTVAYLMIRTFRPRDLPDFETGAWSIKHKNNNNRDPQKRAAVIDALAERGVDFDTLATAAGQPEADPFDLLCHVAFNSPLRTRRERAERLRKDRRDFFDQFAPEARSVLEALLEKYAEFGTAQFVIPDILEVPPLSEQGNTSEIADRFGGPVQLRYAVSQLQTLLYAA
jgi:hypothetical protein